MNPECTRLVSSSKDSTARIWDARTGRCLLSLSGHTMSMTCVKWGGEGLIYTASQDRSIKVFEAASGKLCRTLAGHGHWVNSLALNTDYVLRTGAYDHTGVEYGTKEEAQKAALCRYQAIITMAGSELLVSGSDDFTLHLWDPTKNKHPLTRMTGHQNLVNLVSYSPDGRLIASASFDKSIKLWHGVSGKFISSLRAHVEAVYQVSWSSDSRMLVSGSRDSTLKVWDTKTGQRKQELPGHADEVYSVDWSPDGQRVASGSKDRLLKIWQT